MVEIIPAIIGKDFTEVFTQIEKIGAQAKWLQLDISDGLFTPRYTWQEPADLDVVEGNSKLEAHLMIEEPEVYIDEWLKVADRITIHYEATDKLDQIVEKFKNLPNKLGVSLMLATPLEVLDKHIAHLDTVQLMGIEKIGYQGQEFSERVVGRVRALRAKYPDVRIQVDGGVNLANAPALIAAGATGLVVGSGIWQAADPLAALAQFQKLTS